MKEIDIAKLAEAVRETERFAYECANLSAEDLDRDLKHEVTLHLCTFVQVCSELGLSEAITPIQLALSWFYDFEKNSPREGSIHLDHVLAAVTQQLNAIRFLAIAKDRIQYYDSIEQFGQRSYEAFPSAQSDIREAMRCLALEANTASVFHFMRVAEYGLRALAKDRRVEVLNSKGSEIPTDLATWDEVIRGLEKSEVEIVKMPKTHAREAQMEFYHGALMEIRRFKNIFRNRVAHARDDYDRDQAVSVFNHVREFMNILASRISENSEPLPEIWTNDQIA